MAVLLADHLGSGDYNLTVVLVVAAIETSVVLALVAAKASHRAVRVIAVATSASLAFITVRIFVNWEEAAEQIHQLTGPQGSEFHGEFLDDLVRVIAGVPTAVLFLSLLPVGYIVSMWRTRHTTPQFVTADEMEEWARRTGRSVRSRPER